MTYGENHFAARVFSTITGGAIGDALGVPVEFKRRGTFNITGMTGYGTHDQPPGTWSDDTSLTLCLMENIVEGGDEERLMKKFADYLERGYMTPYGQCFDIGGTTVRALSRYRAGTEAALCGQAEEHDNGNGALMRIAPVVFLNVNDYDIHSRIAKIERWSALTHAHPRSTLGCILYVRCLQQLYEGSSKAGAIENASRLLSEDLAGTKYQDEMPHYGRIFSGEIKNLKREDIYSDGYVVHTLEAAFWCFLNNRSFKETVLEAVNLGGDTDTTGMVAGSLAGMYYGAEHEWLDAPARIEDITNLCKRFAMTCLPAWKPADGNSEWWRQEMNALEKEYVFLARKVWRDEYENKTYLPENYIGGHDGIVRLETADEGCDLTYCTASGSAVYIDFVRDLLPTLLRDGDIQPVERPPGKINTFSDDLADAKIERARVFAYLQDLRAKIASGEITV